ncbi:malonyl-CoA decarboxylase-domain-containing protein [Mucor mucedo]|uniref:malonyl-CoA decarboxylase-domain-containing protein n=1 Tax=Mucor mucedo TaxID=29922 RepID=UPI00221EDEE4|nr:malonyl-CoA decarboxylase-domain-containing protein [Mucor mucedo]KAI7884473.1 malonyl-CoA decarboxylase-domain-containing protein [Mucor mucedo]
MRRVVYGVLPHLKQTSRTLRTRPEFMQELVEKVTENNNNLPPPAFTAKCCDYFKQLDKHGKRDFFKILATEFDVDRENAVKEAKSYVHEQNKSVEQNLLHYLEPKYALFFDRIHQLPNGLKLLADMRSDLLDIMGQRESESYLEFTSLEQDIRLKLKKYVIGFLKLEQLTWQTSSAELLEKICSYEAVHAVKDWKDIKRRLASDRRVFAFVENTTPNEPLVFVHVALVPSISTSVQAILNEPLPLEEETKHFKCAICYSITTQPGLGGINLGNYLIKQVVDRLKTQYPQLETFATLSPLPGFRKWLMHHDESDPSIVAELGLGWKTELATFEGQEQWKSPLMRLCARYILDEKRIETNALDPRIFTYEMERVRIKFIGKGIHLTRECMNPLAL